MIELGLGFCLLGDGALVEHVGDFRNRMDHGLRQAAVAKLTYEAAIDLQVIHVEFAQVTE